MLCFCIKACTKDSVAEIVAENLKSLSKYKTEKTEHSVLTDEICLSERHEENKRRC